MTWQDEEDIKLLWEKAIVFGQKFGPGGPTVGFAMPTGNIDLAPDEAEAMGRILLRLASETRKGRP